MLIIATFENSSFIELAISSLEQNGIAKEKIFAIPLDKRTEQKQLFDSIHRADGFSMFDIGAILGTCFMLLGAIYGFVLKWGPIIWGIIGMVSGLILGIVIKWFFIKKNKTGTRKITSEVVVMIRCEDPYCEKVEKILWEHKVLGVAKVK